MAPQATEYFPVDFAGDLESIWVHESALDSGDLDIDSDPQPQELGVEGIKVKPPKAKWYANLVSFTQFSSSWNT